MKQYAQLETLIFSFCQRYDVPLIQPDEHLKYTLLVDDIEIQCYLRGTNIYIEAKYSVLKSQELLANDASNYKKVMQHALLASKHSTAVIALSNDGSLLLSKKLPSSQWELPAFEEAIEFLVNELETLLGVLGRTNDVASHENLIGASLQGAL